MVSEWERVSIKPFPNASTVVATLLQSSYMGPLFVLSQVQSLPLPLSPSLDAEDFFFSYLQLALNLSSFEYIHLNQCSWKRVRAHVPFSLNSTSTNSKSLYNFLYSQIFCFADLSSKWEGLSTSLLWLLFQLFNLSRICLWLYAHVHYYWVPKGYLLSM